MREFFRRLTWNDIDQMANSVIVGGKEVEAAQTMSEAAQSIPLIRQFYDTATKAQSANEMDTYAYFSAQSILLTAIFRIAEDMGYEW